MKISVIIPCFNAESFVERAVNSVMKQTYREFELIAVDDHSTDGTFNKLNQLQQSYPDMHILKSSGKGACAARNTGFSVATGDYLLFLDADDELLPEKLTSDVHVIEKSESPALVVGAYHRKSSRSSEIAKTREGNPFVRLFNGELGCTCSNLFKRSAFEQSGKWNEDLQSSQEADLMLRVLRVDQNIAWNPEPNTVVYIDSSIISKRDPTGNLRRYFDVRMKIYEELISRDMNSEDVKRNAGFMFFGILHRMYALNPEQAIAMHEIVRNKQISIAAGPGVSASYRNLYRIFGFRLTEKLFYSRQ